MSTGHDHACLRISDHLFPLGWVQRFVSCVHIHLLSFLFNVFCSGHLITGLEHSEYLLQSRASSPAHFHWCPAIIPWIHWRVGLKKSPYQTPNMNILKNFSKNMCMCMSIQRPEAPYSLRAGVTGSCRMSGMGAENQNPVLCRNSMNS